MDTSAVGYGARLVAKSYRLGLELMFMLAPAGMMGYLLLFQDQNLLFRDYVFHETAITLSIVLSGFAAWVAWRCYRQSGLASLRHIALAFSGFGFVYFFHGALTHTADHNIWLFLLFGPASRVVMAGFLFVALLHYGEQPEDDRRASSRLLPWLGVMVAVSLLVVWASYSPLASSYWLRFAQEAVSAALCVAGVAVIRMRRLRTALMWQYQVALMCFAQSSVGFLLAKPWNHLWWFSHVVFAGGFFMLSYGIVRAFLVSDSFGNVYSEEEMVVLLAARDAESRALRDGQERLKVLFEASPVGIVVAEPGGRVLFCNQRQAELLGLEPSDALTRNEREFYAQPSLRERCVGQAVQFNVPATAELECQRADGSRSWSLVTWTPVLWGGGRCLVAWNLDVTERRQAAETLARAKDEAELASRAKTEFLAAMSHELRTPLNAVIGFTETMEAEFFGPLGSPRYKEYCRHVLEAGRHLTALIDDVLDVAKVESGFETLREAPVPVARLVEAAVVMIGERARDRGLSVAVEVPGDAPALVGDERRLKQVLLNLLANAVKFTPSGGKVRVVAQARDDGGLAIQVIDTGIGIRPEDRDKVLAAFGQVEGAFQRRYDGLGLGLSLAYNLTRMHGGRLDIDGQLGHGTTVTLSFPKDRVVA